ncbi:MAG: peptide deformylase [Candidatus Rokuibacteriota bacterium]|jgi:peptide deformylase|nr:MAG: peptide deformylase [Candidatus Rokubacteria bacterium]
MALLTVRLYGDPALRQPAKPVEAVTPEIAQMLDDMMETMYQEVGVGLAATQVGIGLRMLVLDEGTGGGHTYVNPRIVDQGGEEVDEEGCLSIPGIYADVARAAWVVVDAQDRTGAPIHRRANGFPARVLQHEIDHLDGILFIDRLDKVTRDRIKRRIKREGFPEGAVAHAGVL